MEILIKKKFKIPLLHLNLDVHNITLYYLKKLYEKIVYNGIILLDDYGIKAGATKAVDIFLKNKKVTIQKFHYHNHGSFIIKQE